MAKILVTGAAGFMGRHLLRRLVAEGRHSIEGLARKMPAKSLQGCLCRQVDLLRPEQIAAYLSGFAPYWIFHLAGVHNGSRQQLLAGNLQVTVNLFNALEAQVVPQPLRLLAIGSAAEYGMSLKSGVPVPESAALEPMGDYGYSKVEQWNFIRERTAQNDLEVVYVRPFNLLGPGLSTNLVAGAWARQIAQIEVGLVPPILQTGNLWSARDFVDIRDAVRAYRLLMEKGGAGQVYNISSGVALPLEELLGVFQEKAQIPFSVERVAAYTRGGDLPIACGDNTALRRATGWEPEIGIERAVEDLLDYWRETVAAEKYEDIASQ